MSQSAKGTASQGGLATARRRQARALNEDAMSHATAGFVRAGFADPALVLRWSEIAGPQLARLAQPVKFQDARDGAVLTLRCDPGAAVFLQHEMRSLIERLNFYLGRGRIARLKFVTGSLSRAFEPPSHPGLLDSTRRDTSEPSDLNDALLRLARGRRKISRPA